MKLWALVLILSSTMASADSLSTKQLRYAERVYKNVLLKCPDRIWPQVNWGDTQFLFISPRGRSAWIVTAARPGLTTLPLKDIPSALQPTRFAIATWRNQTTISINLDDSSDGSEAEPMSIAVHELFHHIAQKDWKMKETSADPLVPLVTEPRYFRYRLLHSLQSTRPQDLKAAAYWRNRWRTSAPEEADSNSDLREGTAKYVERLVVALGELGCESSTALIHKAIQRWLNDQELDVTADIELEGYWIGAGAALWLDKTKKDWKSKMAEGGSPVDLLLESVGEEPQSDDEGLKQRLATQTEMVNKEIARVVAPFEGQFKDAKNLRVAISEGMQPEVISYEAIFRPRSHPQTIYYRVASGEAFKAPQTSYGLKLSQAQMLAGESDSVCGRNVLLLPIEKNRLVTTKDVYSYKSRALTLSLKGDLKEAGGFTYLCPKAEAREVQSLPPTKRRMKRAP